MGEQDGVPLMAMTNQYLTVPHPWVIKGHIPIREDGFIAAIRLTAKSALGVLLGTILLYVLENYYPSSYFFPLQAVAYLPLLPLYPIIFIKDTIGGVMRSCHIAAVSTLLGTILCVIYIAVVKSTCGDNIAPSPWITALVEFVITFASVYANFNLGFLKLLLLTVVSLLADFQSNPSNQLIEEFKMLLTVFLVTICTVIGSYIPIPKYASVEVEEELKRVAYALASAYKKLNSVFSNNETPYNFILDNESACELIASAKEGLKAVDAYLPLVSHEFENASTIQDLYRRSDFLKALLQSIESMSFGLAKPIKTPLKRKIYAYLKSTLDCGVSSVATAIINYQFSSEVNEDDTENVQASLNNLSDSYHAARRKYLWKNDDSNHTEEAAAAWVLRELFPINNFIFYTALIMRQLISYPENDERKEVTSWSLKSYWYFFQAPTPLEADDYHRIKRALNVSTAILIASIVPLLPYVSNILPFGAWTNITIVLISDEYIGGSITTSIARLVGTICGGVLGGVILICALGNQIAITLLLFCWALVTAYVSTHPRFGYMGNVSCFTTIIVLFGYAADPNNSLDVSAFAYMRIQQVFFGVLVYSLVLNLMFPVIDSTLARHRVAAMLSSLGLSIEYTFSYYNSIEVSKKVPPELIANDKSIPASLPRLIGVIDAAGHEPVLWRKPFPQPLYFRLYKNVENVHSDLVRMRIAVERMNDADYAQQDRETNPSKIKTGPGYSYLLKVCATLHDHMQLIRSAFEQPRIEGSKLLTEQVAWNQQLRDEFETFLQLEDESLYDAVWNHRLALSNMDIITFNSFVVATQALVEDVLELGISVARIISKEKPPSAMEEIFPDFFYPPV